MRLLRAPELSQVGGTAYLGRCTCAQLCCAQRSKYAEEHVVDWQSSDWAANLNFLCPLFPALSFLLLILLYYFCDPTSTSCLSYATGGSQVWRGERKSLSFL